MAVIAKSVDNVVCAASEGGCGAIFNTTIAESGGWQCACPKCGRTFHPGATSASGGGGGQRFYGNRRFAGSESVSLMEGCHPREVAKMKRLMPEVQHCIKSDGRVEFADRSEQRKYARRTAELRQSGVLH